MKEFSKVLGPLVYDWICREWDNTPVKKVACSLIVSWCVAIGMSINAMMMTRFAVSGE